MAQRDFRGVQRERLRNGPNRLAVSGSDHRIGAWPGRAILGAAVPRQEHTKSGRQSAGHVTETRSNESTFILVNAQTKRMILWITPSGVLYLNGIVHETSTSTLQGSSRVNSAPLCRPSLRTLSEPPI